MNYTANYLKLLEAVREVNFQIAVDYRNRNKALDLLATLKSLAEVVNKLEREAGNTEDYTNPHTGEYSEDLSFSNPPNEKQSLQFEIDMVLSACGKLINIYSNESSLQTTIEQHTLDNHNHIAILGETTIVPVATSGVESHLVEYLNKSIVRYLKYTEDLDERILSKDKTKQLMIMDLTADITMEVTEDPKPNVNKQLKNVEEFENRLRKLGLIDGHKISDYIDTADLGTVDKLLLKLNGEETGTTIKKSSIFGN